MATATEAAPGSFVADPVLTKAIIDGVNSCLSMCDTEARCVGVSTIPTSDPGMITGMIGVHGTASGFITVNLAEEVAMSAVGGLLQDRFEKLTPQVIDGVGEMTNLISGGIKMGLSGSDWAFSHVTVPSVIIGQQYQIAYASGLRFLSVSFEQKNDEALLLDDRLIKVAISLIRV
ncbi:MAG: chemotaxis protein CheX [Candidatus Nealsonbacteria bacterium]|nr:chemotaxis protein CheX [Candidatus Nealsonbacteria bacterium]